MDELEKRKEEALEKLKILTAKPKYLIWAAIALIISWGLWIRTRNLSIIQWQYPIDPDSYAFLRYAKYIVDNGRLMDIDMLRYYPIGWSNLSEFRVLSYFIAYLYKFLNFLVPSVTIENADVLYPVICFAIGTLFFFLFVKKLFNWKTALASSAFLIVMPAYLYRTMAGAADKEAFAMMTLFATLYFFITAWKSKDLKKATLFGIASGLATAITGAVWGGVQFLFLIISTFTFILFLLGNINTKKIGAYLGWALTMIVSLRILYPERFYLSNWLSGVQNVSTIFVIGSLILYYFIQKNPTVKTKLLSITKNKLPIEIITPVIIGLIGILTISIMKGPGNIIFQLKDALILLTEPFGTSRWSLTVAEAHLPSFGDWIGQFRWKALWMGLGGGALAFYTMTKQFGKRRIIPTAIFTLALVGISVSRYSPSSPILNGSSGLARLLYFGSLFAIFGLFAYSYYTFYKKDKDSFNLLKKLNHSTLFALIITIYLMVSAKTAIRLLFVFAPAVALMVGYFVTNVFDRLKKLNNNTYKLIGYAILLVIVVTTLTSFSQASINQARYTGSSYTQQWVQGMNWVQENTPEDAIFAHWWDYGYYVQTGGNRATLSDGGNARGAINYFIGRHVLTGQNEIEALELLKANDATHLLIIHEEIGKYPAFSSIGSDANYDRYGWINTFILNPEMIQETRNETILAYTGGTALDQDLIYQDKIYPEGAAGIGAVLLPLVNEEVTNGNETTIVQNLKQPSIILAYQGQQIQIPLECVHINGAEQTFPEKGYAGCLKIIPTISGPNEGNQIGAGLLLSPKVRTTVFTKLFLYDQPTEHFTKIYSDETSGMPLAVYQGRLIGPMKIWEISYPDDLEIPELYYGTEEPSQDVTVVGKQF